ncbi:MAG: class I SAM-dependent RNA methyltransferase [Treponema sp.]|jgi:23S rRNA (uracil1939-C5)-methyltransferase|nr:class I SAM-dependent RNA methyltransferase [Treponema sp.]
MAIGDIFTAPVESVALGGNGILRHEGRAVFMPLSAPGDTVTGRIREEHRDWALAELLEVTEPSPLRTKPACPLYGGCGGCSLQHINYRAQLDAKKAALEDCLKRIGGFAALPGCAVVPSPPWEYRNRVSFHAIRANRGPAAGFKARKSGRTIPVHDCPVLDPEIRALLRGNALKAPPGKDRFTVFSGRGIVLSEGGEFPSRGAVKLAGKTIHLEAGSFFQNNLTMLEKLVPVLRSAAEESGRDLPMADLYAGVGTFSVFLADLFPGSDLLEENRASLELAKRNLGPGAFRFYAKNDEAWARRQSPDTGYGFAVADPPRQGLSRSMARRLAQSGPPVLAYVSCEPSSLARDCRILASAYEIEKLMFFDFYPQTAHIESLVVLRRRGARN